MTDRVPHVWVPAFAYVAEGLRLRRSTVTDVLFRRCGIELRADMVAAFDRQPE